MLRWWRGLDHWDKRFFGAVGALVLGLVLLFVVSAIVQGPAPRRGDMRQQIYECHWNGKTESCEWKTTQYLTLNATPEVQ